MVRTCRTNQYDLIIIGSGPAGLTAAIYAARYNLNFLVIGKVRGGTISEAYKICNFPTQNNIGGFELTQELVKHVEELNGKIELGEVTEIDKFGKEFIVKTDREEYRTQKIILALGREKQKLGVEGEEKFLKRGISYCATCDADFYKGKVVAVIGGGNAAVTSALLLAEYAKKVYIIYRKEKFFRADSAWVKQLEKNKKIETMFGLEVKEIYGNKSVRGIKLTNGDLLNLDGVFIEIGSVPDTGLSGKLGVETEKGYIIVDKTQRTNISGIFAAGDITNNPLKQAITACGEGAVAADSVFKEVKYNEI